MNIKRIFITLFVFTLIVSVNNYSQISVSNRTSPPVLEDYDTDSPRNLTNMAGQNFSGKDVTIIAKTIANLQKIK